MKQKQEMEIPVSGYEHTVRFDVAGVHLDVPYGYLYEYSSKVKQVWLQNNDKRYEIEPLKIMVAERETLAPYNQETQHHFKNYIQGTGSDAVSILVRDGQKCETLNQESAISNLIALKYNKIINLPTGFVGYEKEIDNFYEKSIYYKDNIEKTSINIEKSSKTGKFVAQIFSCKNNLYIHYYLDYEPRQEFPIAEVIKFNSDLNNLIEDMIVN